MDTNAVFDALFSAFPKARESASMRRKPKGTLEWKKKSSTEYVAWGPRGGLLRLRYSEVSNKITLTRVQ